MKNCTLCYIENENQEYLMLHRVKKFHDVNQDKWIGVGGKFEADESPEECLLREVREETGLTVIPASVRPYGYVHRVEKGDREDCFVQDNYYYFCGAEQEISAQRLDDYEAEERFTLEFVPPETAITVNRTVPHGPKEQTMLEREARVLELLMEEGYL